MVIKQNASEVKEAQEAKARPERDNTALSLTFTISQWRLIAVACGRIKDDVFIEQSNALEVKAIAKLIAEQTGKSSE